MPPVDKAFNKFKFTSVNPTEYSWPLSKVGARGTDPLQCKKKPIWLLVVLRIHGFNQQDPRSTVLLPLSIPVNNCRRNQFQDFWTVLKWRYTRSYLKFTHFSVNVHCVFCCCCIGLFVSDILAACPGLLRKIEHPWQNAHLPSSSLCCVDFMELPSSSSSHGSLCPWS